MKHAKHEALLETVFEGLVDYYPDLTRRRCRDNIAHQDLTIDETGDSQKDYEQLKAKVEALIKSRAHLRPVTRAFNEEEKDFLKSRRFKMESDFRAVETLDDPPGTGPVCGDITIQNDLYVHMMIDPNDDHCYDTDETHGKTLEELFERLRR